MYLRAGCHKYSSANCIKITSLDETECHASVSPAALTQGLAHLTVKLSTVVGELRTADCTASWHSKSRREHKDFGPDQSAIL